MKNRTKILFVFLFIISLLTLNFNVFSQPVAIKGIIDLTECNFSENKVISLNGDWEIYWKKLLTPKDFNDSTVLSDVYISVPGIWNDKIAGKDTLTGFGFCTFRLILKLKNEEQNLAIYIRDISLAYTLWIGDELILNTGKVASNEEDYFGIFKPSTRFFTIKKDEQSNDEFIYVPLLMQVANFGHPRGAIWDEIYFGSQEQISNSNKNKLIVNFIIIGIVLIMMLYHFGLFFMRKKNLSLLYFAITALLYCVRGMATNERIIVEWFPRITFEILNKIEYFTSYATITFFVLFFSELFKQYFPRVAKYIILIPGIFTMLIIVLTPASVYATIKLFFDILTFLATIYLCVFLFRLSLKKVSGAFLAFLGIFIGMFVVIVNDILYSMTIIQSTYLVPYGFVFYIFIQSVVLAKNFTLAFKQNEELTKKLDYQNKNLENRVVERTHEIMMQKEEIQSQKEELEIFNEKMFAQNLEIQEKNNKITHQKDFLERSNREITASITYARRIQQAIFPKDEWLATTFLDYFVIWKPKDIVSGDFFWLKVYGKFTIVAAADSTGHGVPGAFMSMLGISILNDIVTYRNAKIPGQILNEMRHAVKKLLNQKGDSQEQKDGFDISLCSIDNIENKLYYSGANLPLYIIQNGTLKEIKPLRNPISIYLLERQFETQEMPLESNDTIYMFSDGIIDMIGGDASEKFKAFRLKKLLSDICLKSLYEQKIKIEEIINSWMNEEYGQIDDILVLGIKI